MDPSEISEVSNQLVATAVDMKKYHSEEERHPINRVRSKDTKTRNLDYRRDYIAIHPLG